jgi:tetratricopeptide (TPR) repeat protein
MSWTSGPCRLRGFICSAAMVVTSCVLWSQVPPSSEPPAISVTNPTPSSPSPDVDHPATQSAPAPAPLIIPAPPPTPEEVGDSLMSHQRYQAAIAAYKKAPELTAVQWNKIGIAYQMMLNPQEAEHCYQTSLKLDPKNSQVLNNLATVYDSMKEYGSAERIYHRAVKLDPHSAMIYKNLGTNLLAQHKYKKGWEFYKTALQLDPHIFESSSSPRTQNPASVAERGAMNFYMAKGCVRAGMKECAIDYLRMALNEGFTDPKKIEADSEFASLRGIPAFEQLLASQKQQ